MKKIILLGIIFTNLQAIAQTELDGIFLNKKLLCVGAVYSRMQWQQYWEGNFKRENLNLGKVSANSIAVNANYGLTNSINLLANAQYVATKASAGQLAGLQGLQDLAMHTKWSFYKTTIKAGTLNCIAIAGFSLPLSNYTPDLMPLSIGLKSKTATARVMVDYQKNKWFATLSGSYAYRGNVTLDRNTYYTSTLRYTNKVEMPNVTTLNIRAGYRSSSWVIEAFANQMNSLSGFDITKNNMPFVSNKMNATTTGLHFKYIPASLNGLEVVADGITTIYGRNVGQNTGISAGIFYLMNVAKKKKTK